MGQLQEFLGIENYISEKNFDMEDRLPCFKENVETKCLKGTKGRSVGKQFENTLGSVLKRHKKTSLRKWTALKSQSGRSKSINLQTIF